MILPEASDWFKKYLLDEKACNYWVSTDPNRSAPFQAAPFAREAPRRGLVFNFALLFESHLAIFPKGKCDFLVFGGAAANLRKAYVNAGISVFRLLGNYRCLACFRDPTFGDLEQYKRLNLLLTHGEKSPNYPEAVATRSKGRKADAVLFTLDFHSLLR